MPLRIAQTGDIHLEQDRYFTDTVQCLEWFVEDAIRANTNLFVVNGVGLCGDGVLKFVDE